MKLGPIRQSFSKRRESYETTAFEYTVLGMRPMWTGRRIAYVGADQFDSQAKSGCPPSSTRGFEYIFNTRRVSYRKS